VSGRRRDQKLLQRYVIHQELPLVLNMDSQLCPEFGHGLQQLATRFRLLAFVARHICPEAATVHGVGTVYVPDVEGEIPAGVRHREELAWAKQYDGFVVNLDFVSSSS